jgi:hypothetical protein
METVNRDYLIKCNNESEIEKVFSLLDSLKEPIGKDEFRYTTDWHYVGFYNYSSKWTIARPGPNFGSDVISFDDFIEKYKPAITMEEIQKECIKRFPIGCKFTSPGCTIVKTLKEDHVTYEISGEHIYAHSSAGCLYDKGEYATLVSLPEEKTTSIPEYVECITDHFMGIDQGVIYKLQSISPNDSYFLEGVNIGSYSKEFFKPSTKEAYNAQFTKQEPIYAYIGDPLPKPLIDNVQSINVNLRTKKKTNKLKF